MADETTPHATLSNQLEAWKTEALNLAGDPKAAESLIRRVHEAGQADARTTVADAISALEQELAKLRRATVTAGS